MTTPSIPEAAAAGRSKRWPVVFLLTIGIIIAYVDRINLSSALPEIHKCMPDWEKEHGRGQKTEVAQNQ